MTAALRAEAGQVSVLMTEHRRTEIQPRYHTLRKDAKTEAPACWVESEDVGLKPPALNTA